jgi:hypothetical protein
MYASSQIGLNMVSVLDSMKREFGSAEINFVKALDAVDATDASKIAEAVEAAKKSEIAVVVVGDRAGLFGRGTSGEGCDAEDLDLPGIQVGCSPMSMSSIADACCSASSSRRSSRAERQSFLSYSPAGRTQSTGRSISARPLSRPSSRVRKVAARSPASCPGA